MKIFAILLLLATNSYADYIEPFISGNSQTVIVNGVGTGIKHTAQGGALAAALIEAQKCGCAVIIKTADIKVQARKVITSSSSAASSYQSSAQSSQSSEITVLSAIPPKLRMDGVALLVSEYGGYKLRVNARLIDIPNTSAEPLVYPINFPIAKTDIITIAFYDKAKLTSDFVPVTF